MCDAADPLHLPHLIGPMKHYLWILKTTHGGADMDTCVEMARGSLDGQSAFALAFCHVVMIMSVTVTGYVGVCTVCQALYCSSRAVQPCGI